MCSKCAEYHDRISKYMFILRGDILSLTIIYNCYKNGTDRYRKAVRLIESVRERMFTRTMYNVQYRAYGVQYKWVMW